MKVRWAYAKPSRVRPAAWAAARILATLSRYRSGWTTYDTQPSPWRPARARAASERPPIQIGGPGRCTGFGSIETSLNRVNRSEEHTSELQSQFHLSFRLLLL